MWSEKVYFNLYFFGFYLIIDKREGVNMTIIDLNLKFTFPPWNQQVMPETCKIPLNIMQAVPFLPQVAYA